MNAYRPVPAPRSALGLSSPFVSVVIGWLLELSRPSVHLTLTADAVLPVPFIWSYPVGVLAARAGLEEFTRPRATSAPAATTAPPQRRAAASRRAMRVRLSPRVTAALRNPRHPMCRTTSPAAAADVCRWPGRRAAG